MTASGLERPAVVARNVGRRFGERQVLDGLNLTIASGEFVALLGRSGTGKSTFLRAVGGLDPEVTGTISVPKRRSFVFQDPSLMPWKRVIHNVILGSRAVRPEMARAALVEVGLAGHERAWPATLSGGEAQRVALARALVREPQLLLADEPFGALDALTRIRMHQLLRELCERHRPAVLLVTHDVDEALLLANRVLVLTAGRISLDRATPWSGQASLDTPGFAAFRAELLRELGVENAQTEVEQPAMATSR